MGKITLTVEGTTVGTVVGGGGIIIEKEVSEQDSARLIAAYGRTYSIPITNAASFEAVLERWFGNVVQTSVDHVLAVEKQVASEQASSAVQQITVT
jgi:hypothetical protein